MFGVKCNENCISSRQLPSFYAFFFKADEMMLDCNSMKSCILKIYHEANITRGYFAVFSLLDI